MPKALAILVGQALACMQKMQRSGVPEHFSAAKTNESVLPRLVTAQRAEKLAMTRNIEYRVQQVRDYNDRFATVQ
jgi:hypothetical protein